MAATRTYYRDKNGRFAGSSGGRATVGRSGGFASATHRSRVSASRANARMQPGQRLSRKNVGPRVRHVLGNKSAAQQAASAAILFGAVQSRSKGLRAASTAVLVAASVHGKFKYAQRVKASNSKRVKRTVGRG